MKRINVSILLIFAGIMYTMCVLVQTSMSQVPENNVVLRELLRKVGDKYDCHFTMEIGLVSGNNTNSLAGRRFSPELKGETLLQELELLRKSTPNFTYRFDDLNPKIIHIIDSRLSREGTYAMGKTIRSLRFNGGVFDLINAIGQKGLSISSRGAVSLYELRGVDASTQVHIQEKNKKVRAILTNVLMLQERGRVLWIAETEIGINKTTYVRYFNRNM